MLEGKKNHIKQTKTNKKTKIKRIFKQVNSDPFSTPNVAGENMTKHVWKNSVPSLQNL